MINSLLSGTASDPVTNLRLDLCQSLVQIGQEILSGSESSNSIFALGSSGALFTGSFTGFASAFFGFFAGGFSDISVFIFTFSLIASFDPFNVTAGKGAADFMGLMALREDGID